MSETHDRVVDLAMKIVQGWMLSENLRVPRPVEALALGVCMGELRRLRGLRNPGTGNPDFSPKRPHKTRRN